MSRGLFVFVVVTGILTAVVVVFPHAVFVGLIYFLVPGLILTAAPTLFIISATLYYGSAALQRDGRPVSYRIPAIFLVVIGLLLPLLFNFPHYGERGRLSEGDQPLNGYQFSVKTIALLTPDPPSWSSIRPTDCIDICQRLLFNGSVQAVLLGSSPNGLAASPFGNDNRLMRYRIERRASCPSVRIPNAGVWSGEPFRNLSYITVVSDRVKARMDDGECLIAEPAKIAEADLVIVDQLIKSGAVAYDHPWQPYLDTLTAKRLSVYERKDGSLREVFRQTSLEAEPVFTPLIIGPVGRCGDGICRSELGIVRGNYKSGRYDLRQFLQSASGLNVGIVAEVPNMKAMAQVRETLAVSTLATDSPKLKTVDDFLKVISERGALSDEEVTLMRQIISDRRINSLHLSSAIDKLGNQRANIAGVILERIAASDPQRDGFLIEHLSGSVRTLPPKALVSVMPQLLALADNERLRGKAWRALVRVSDAGPESVPTLLRFIELGQATKISSDPDRDLIRAGLTGLCLLGSEAAAAAPRVLAILGENPGDPSLDSRTALTIAALVRMGQEQAVENNYRERESLKPFVRRRIDQTKKLSDEEACRY